MSSTLYSDNQADVDALARRIVALTSFSSDQAASVAFSLLCRKVLKIKSGALAQLFKSVNAEVDTKRMRDEFLKSGLIVKIQGTGLGGRPAVYRICANVSEPTADDADGREDELGDEETAEGAYVEAAIAAEEEVESAVEQNADQQTDEQVEKSAEKQPEKQFEKSAAKQGGQSKKRIEQSRQGKRSKKKGQQDRAAKPAQAPTHEPATEQTESADDFSKRPSPVAIARVLTQRIVRVLPAPTTLAKVREKRAEIVHVSRPQVVPVEETQPRAVHGNSAKSQTAMDFATITAWIDQAHNMNVPYASRRQRAFEIFNDEKAFDGKRGERLFKRLNDRGVNISALKITPQRTTHFQGFYGIGADKPFVVVENIDTYEEIVRLLRGNSSTKLFGVRVSGVVFGGGCKVNVAHALDDYLADIGYRYDYVYYAGDIDREGARIVEQARAANNVKIRLHAGMYRAMLAAHARRVKEGKTVEPASQNQGVPQNLARAIDDLPMVTRVQFRNVLRQGGRIPQEILTSADYRDSSSGPVERLLNK